MNHLKWTAKKIYLLKKWLNFKIEKINMTDNNIISHYIKMEELIKVTFNIGRELILAKC